MPIGTTEQIRPTRVHEKFVLAKCSFFATAQVWPLPSIIDPERWLRNFLPSEKEHAIQLLHSFLYFGEAMRDQLLRTAVQRLSCGIRPPGASYSAARDVWQNFLNASLFTRVTGTRPHDSDSGYLFSRSARQVLQIPATQILGPEEALRILLTTKSPLNLIFLDDVAASGQTFIDTWQNKVLTNEHVSSFETCAWSQSQHRFLFCPLLCTEYAFNRIQRKCPDVEIHPSHLIPQQYGVLEPDSILWPPDLLPSATAFIEQASMRAGIPQDSWRGYHDLGLALAFNHSIPDATLPVFYWQSKTWHPLMERR